MMTGDYLNNCTCQMCINVRFGITTSDFSSTTPFSWNMHWVSTLVDKVLTVSAKDLRDMKSREMAKKSPPLPPVPRLRPNAISRGQEFKRMQMSSGMARGRA